MVNSLLNLLIQSTKVVNSLGLGLLDLYIKPIYKSSELPSNYRGITLLKIMGKLLMSIFNVRHLEWAESKIMIHNLVL